MPFAYAYARPELGREAASLDEQLQAIDRYYSANLKPEFGWAGLYWDAPAVGKLSFSDRRGGGVLNSRLERGDQLIIAKLHCAFPIWRDFAVMAECWTARGVGLHLLDFRLSRQPLTGRKLLRMIACFARYERGRRAEWTRAGLAKRKQAGKASGHYAGYGFRYIGSKGRRRKVPDPQERQVMAEILRMHLEGFSWADIYVELLGQRVTTREGKEWSVRRIERACQAELALRESEGEGGFEKVQS